MAQYKPGGSFPLVNVTNGSPTVVIQNNNAVGSVLPGHTFYVAGVNTGRYEVSTVVYSAPNTNVTLTTNYGGTNATGATGVFHSDFTSNVGLPLVYDNDLEFPALNRRQMELIDARFVAPPLFQGAASIINTGVDGTYQDALIAYYTSAVTEKNVIQTSVSSTASQSGFLLAVSNGGGSSAVTNALRVNRDAVRVLTSALVVNGTTNNGTDALQVTGSGSFTGSIKTTESGVVNDSFNATGSTINRRIIRLGNSGGDAIFGIDDNAGGTTIVGASAYDTIIRGPSGISFSANGSALHVRVTNAGFFGIGASPATKFQVTHAGLVQGRFYNTTNGTDLRIVADTDHAGVKLDNAGMPLLFSLGGGEAARFSATNRNFLINTTTDESAYKLQVNGSGIFTGSVEVGTAYTGTTTLSVVGQTSIIAINAPSGNERYVAFRTSGSNRWLIRTSATVESGTNVGSDFYINSRADDGSDLHIPIFIKRSTGNVLVNTTVDNGVDKLQISGSSIINASSQVAFTVATSNSDVFIRFINSGNSSVYIGNTNAGHFDIQTTSTTRVRVTSGGNTLIGTTTDSIYKLDVFSSSVGVIRASSSSTDASLISIQKTSGTARTWALGVAGSAQAQGVPDRAFFIGDATGGTNPVVIPITGNVLIGTTVDASTRLYVRGVDQTTSNYAAIFSDSVGNAIASFRNDRRIALFNLQNFADDSAAASGGIAVNELYRNGSTVMVRVA